MKQIANSPKDNEGRHFQINQGINFELVDTHAHAR